MTTITQKSFWLGLDKNDAGRDAIIAACTKKKPYKTPDIIRFEGLTQGGLYALSDCNYIIMDYYRMPLSPKNVLDLMLKYDSEETDITAMGYATSVDREDYNVFIDGFEVHGRIPDEIWKIATTLEPVPDEIKLHKDHIRVWYD